MWEIYRDVLELSNVIELSKRDRVIETLYSYRNVIKLSKRDRVIESVIELIETS